jgi:hypothetical protein
MLSLLPVDLGLPKYAAFLPENGGILLKKRVFSSSV